jgi:hypothetical protein
MLTSRSIAQRANDKSSRTVILNTSAFATGVAVGKLTDTPRKQAMAAVASAGVGVLAHLVGPTILPAGPTAAFADGSLASAATILGAQLGARMKK